MEYTKEDKQYFISIFKKYCIENCSNANILPSVVAAIAINNTKWGTEAFFGKTNNFFSIPVDKNWTGWCYSKDTNMTYENYIETKELSQNLYKSYVDHIQSIKDFISYLKSSRRSTNGPLRYTNIFGINNFDELIDILIEDGFLNDLYHIDNEYQWKNDILRIIKSNNLYEWDNEMEVIKLSKKNRPKINIKSHENNNEHMYRVRFSWDKPDTQIFASPKYDDAREVALKHEGYKIFIDDDGELFEDPWKKDPDTEPAKEIDGVVPVIHPIAGHPITLNNTLVYRNAMEKASMMCLSGTFYFYDSTIVNGRARITKNKEVFSKPDPNRILGYIKIR